MNPTRPLLTVVSNADDRFFTGLAVALASATAAASGNYDYRFLVLDGGLSKERVDRLGKTLSRIAKGRNIAATLELLEVDQSRLEALPERRGSRMTYAKMVLPEILPELSSIVYLDADVLCFAGVEEVRPPEGESQWLLAGVRDFFSVIERDCPWLESVPQEERKLPYINCGVMWMNLAGLRDMDFTSKAIEARAAIGAARQGDQSVFNYLCRGRSYLLPSKLNHTTAIGSSEPLCEGDLDLNLHYIGSPKPWLGSPKTSNWLAQQLWHQARSAMFPESAPAHEAVLPQDVSIIRRKEWIYKLLNPKRAAHYRWDMRSLKDPAGIMAAARRYWETRLVG